MIEIGKFGYFWLDTWVMENVVQLATQELCTRLSRLRQAHDQAHGEEGRQLRQGILELQQLPSVMGQGRFSEGFKAKEEHNK